MSKLLKGIGATALTAGLLVGGAAPAFASSTPVLMGGHHGHGKKVDIDIKTKIEHSFNTINSNNECNQIVVALFVAKANCNNGDLDID